jgi:pimeloyl-ACP methyl ester carboxylesterase
MIAQDFETPLGPIRLWGDADVVASDKPVVVAIAGAFAVKHGPLFQLAPFVAPHADLLVGHLPGNHSPVLSEISVEAYARAYSHVLATALAGRPVVLCGASIGGLVALGVRAANVRARVVMEPPLASGKLWPMLDFLRTRLAQAPDDGELRAFIGNVFGVTQGEVRDDVRYEGLLDGLSEPTTVLVGGNPLNPPRKVEKLPSLVDEPERRWLAAQPGVRLLVAQGAGHNVPQEATRLLVGELRASLAVAGLAGDFPSIDEVAAKRAQTPQ